MVCVVLNRCMLSHEGEYNNLHGESLWSLRGLQVGKQGSMRPFYRFQSFKIIISWPGADSLIQVFAKILALVYFLYAVNSELNV